MQNAELGPIIFAPLPPGGRQFVPLPPGEVGVSAPGEGRSDRFSIFNLDYTRSCWSFP